jgi:hypothetical protein
MMSDISGEVYMDSIAGIVFIFTLTAIVRGITGYEYLSLILSLTFFSWVIFFLAMEDKERVARKLYAYLNPGGLESGLRVKTDEENSPHRNLESKTKKGFKDGFPKKAFLVLLLLTTSMLTIDLTNQMTIPNQSYGLLFDGIGAGLLAKERFTGTISALNALPEVNARNASEGFWGFLALILGFFLQLISLIWI